MVSQVEQKLLFPLGKHGDFTSTKRMGRHMMSPIKNLFFPQKLMDLWPEKLTGAFYVGLLDGNLEVAGMIIPSDDGSFPHSLRKTHQ